MVKHIIDICSWIKDDYRNHPVRFCLEVLCWLDSLIVAVIVNTTVPNLPFLILYPLWISGTLTYAWCAYSRGSFGMLATFIMLASMDMYGWSKVLFG